MFSQVKKSCLITSCCNCRNFAARPVGLSPVSPGSRTDDWV